MKLFDALFPKTDLEAAIAREYEIQCQLLCFGWYPSWREVQARLLEIKDLL